MANGNGSNGKTFKITASISGILVLAGILISIGQILEDIDHQRVAYAELRMEIAEWRMDLSKHSNTPAHSDAAKDIEYLYQRVDRIEKRLEKVESK